MTKSQSMASSTLRSEEFERRHVVEFDGDELALANFTGAALKRLGADGSLSSCDSYGLPQQWSAWIYGHPAMVDGFVYTSSPTLDNLSCSSTAQETSYAFGVIQPPLLPG